MTLSGSGRSDGATESATPFDLWTGHSHGMTPDKLNSLSDIFPRRIRMRRKIISTLILAVVGFFLADQSVPNQSAQAQGRGATPELIAKRNSIEQELQSIAIVERKLMIPM